MRLLMANIENVSQGGSLKDALFSTAISFLQDTVIKIGVNRRIKRGVHLARQPDEQFNEVLRQLGLVPDRLWWGPMTLFPRKALFLINQIKSQPPRHLLEIGSGSSTALFAALGEKYGFDVLSIENHQKTIDYVEYLLKDLPCSKRLTIQKCGFIKKSYPDKKKYWWYAADIKRLGDKVDFVFIDGPVGRLVGRNGALPEIISYLSDDHRIFLDDSQREHERNCIMEWKRYYKDLYVETYNECPGIACIKIPFINNYR